MILHCFVMGAIFATNTKNYYQKLKHRGRLRGVGTLRGCGVAARFASASVHLCGKLKIALSANRTVVGVSTFVGYAIIDSLQFCFSYPKKINFSKNPHLPH